jgi:hypothetical protein
VVDARARLGRRSASKPNLLFGEVKRAFAYGIGGTGVAEIEQELAVIAAARGSMSPTRHRGVDLPTSSR